MSSIIENFLVWSEVWALVIPLCIMFFTKNRKDYLRPIYYYIIIAFLLNLAANIISNQKLIGLKLPYHNNVFIYNLHSIIRFACFSYFFILLKQTFYTKLKKLLPLIYIVFVIINFTFSDSINNQKHISGNLLAGEAFLLLIYCMLYYLSQLRDEVEAFTRGQDFWIVTGISIYVVINFFLFLFYVPMFEESRAHTDNIWSVHNVAYIILCLFIAKAFYGHFRKHRRKENLS